MPAIIPAVAAYFGGAAAASIWGTGAALAGSIAGAVIGGAIANVLPSKRDADDNPQRVG